MTTTTDELDREIIKCGHEWFVVEQEIDLTIDHRLPVREIERRQRVSSAYFRYVGRRPIRTVRKRRAVVGQFLHATLDPVEAERAAERSGLLEGSGAWACDAFVQAQPTFSEGPIIFLNSETSTWFASWCTNALCPAIGLSTRLVGLLEDRPGDWVREPPDALKTPGVLWSRGLIERSASDYWFLGYRYCFLRK